MRYVNIVLTTDKRLYIAPPWSAEAGDVVGVTTRSGEQVLKTVELEMTVEYGGEAMSFLEKMVGCELKKINTHYSAFKAEWPGEENTDVQE